ncbi:MAG: MBL fold metallo-hydrolase [Rhizobiales bacterium]|nr:MBL fold metallo-hydrolase [Hyphomicrobiales bacterium]
MPIRRDHYFPNTEPLAPDEMRIVALGTGRPFLRRAQANASWLIELGNGDKFLFDFGSGSQKNFTALEIPYADLTACFATHLHVDHVGDFPNVWVGGWAGGRITPLVVYGPSGLTKEHGTQHFVDMQKSAYAWDTATRTGLLPASGADVEVHEFDYSKVQTIYERNGVRIISFPAVHIYDGPVSLRLEWNGLTFVYSGDTTPSHFFVENAQNADLVIHEAFNSVRQLMERSGYDEKTARGIGTMAHSAPVEAGYVLQQVKPRVGVLYHFFNDFDLLSEIERDVRQHYDGRLVLAQDMMVFNVTRDDIAVRMAVTAEHVWPNKEKHDGFRAAERVERVKMSSWLSERQIFPKF